MVTPSRGALKAPLRWLGAAIGTLLALVACYLAAAWIGSSISRNPEWREPETGIEILVGDNGVHTELVLPLTTDVKDWRSEFPASDVADAGLPYTHVAVSWGEREVFLNTPTWADLTPATVWGAMTGGTALLHVSHYVRPAPSADYRPLRLSRAEYARLVSAIEADLLPLDDRARHRGYFGFDVFYDAPGTYTWRMTCNQWTSDRLAQAGVRTGWWTPLSGGVMKWIERPGPVG